MKKIYIKAKIIVVSLTGFLFSAVYPLHSQEYFDTDSLSKNQPREDIEVYREVDEYGNITLYDSTYKWSYYRNMEIPSDVDSVFENIYSHFSEDFMFYHTPFFPRPFDFGFSFFNDSITQFSNSFDSFFINDIKYIRKMMEEQQRMIEKFLNSYPDFKGNDELGPLLPPNEEMTPVPDEKKKIKLKNDGQRRKLFI